MTTTCISPRQRDVHVVSEALALAVVAPFMVYVAVTARDPSVRAAAAAVAVGTVLVDGWLLYRFTSGNAHS